MSNPQLRLAVVIVNYRTAALVCDCLESLGGELEPGRDVAVIVDNASGDGSADAVERWIIERGADYRERFRVVRSAVNGGFAAGNNVGLRAVTAEMYVLLNSDTIVRPGAIAKLRRRLDAEANIGLVGPRLEWPGGDAQISRFRFRSPLGELLGVARIALLGRWFRSHVTAIDLADRDTPSRWVSFACVAIRRAVIEDIGFLDEGYFMYFEDIDFCWRASKLGWSVLYEPDARVVHLRGGTSSVKSDAVALRRLPGYYYAARARYFRKCYGVTGLVVANLFYTLGWGFTTLLATLSIRPRTIPDRALRDIWLASSRPWRGR